MFNKSYSILKIHSTCIDGTLACLLRSYINLVTISKRQCISLLSVLPHKLMTLLSNINTTMEFPVRGNPSFPVGLVGVHMVRMCIVNVGSPLKNNKQCCFIVISFFYFKDKWIVKATAQIIIQCYFTLQWCMYWASAHPFNVFMFVLGQSVVSCSQASRPCIGAEWHGSLD